MDRDIRNKKLKSGNIFDLVDLRNIKSENFEDIIRNNNLVLERIISCGQKTPGNKWLEESNDEWVILLQGKAELLYESGEKIVMKKGDYIFLPSKTKHKVTYTSKRPYCIWLAVHGKLS